MEKNNDFIEKLVHINRITKVVKGGRRLREEKLLKRERENQMRLESEEKEVKEELSNRLKTFDIDKTTKN